MSSLHLRCKDFDAWKSFLNRIAKIGTGYIIKNDILLASKRNNKPGTTETYPGKHIIRDPFFIDDDSCYVGDGTYVMNDIESILRWIDSIENGDKDCRKDIEYIRTPERIELRMGTYIMTIAELLTTDPGENLQAVANSVHRYDDLIEPIENMADNRWVPFTTENLIHIRNNGIFGIKQTVGTRMVKTRLARSLFCLAGVSRLNTPIALSACYTTLPSTESDVAILRIHTIYKCAQNTNVRVDCIHEYLLLIYDEE